jgi:hypothetical protein
MNKALNKIDVIAFDADDTTTENHSSANYGASAAVQHHQIINLTISPKPIVNWGNRLKDNRYCLCSFVLL